MKINADTAEGGGRVEVEATEDGKAICPHCGHDQVDGDGVMRLPYHSNCDNQGEFECDSCGEPFWIKAHSTVTWETFATADEYDES